MSTKNAVVTIIGATVAAAQKDFATAKNKPLSAKAQAMKEHLAKAQFGNYTAAVTGLMEALLGEKITSVNKTPVRGCLARMEARTSANQKGYEKGQIVLVTAVTAGETCTIMTIGEANEAPINVYIKEITPLTPEEVKPYIAQAGQLSEERLKAIMKAIV